MTRTRTLPAAAVLLALALTGCGSDSDDASPAPPPTASADRAICHDSVQQGTDPDLDPARNQKLGARAALSTSPALAKAGERLVTAAGGAAMTDGQPADRVALAEAQRDVAEACKGLFGPGPW
jgi:outer membrane PBP1 activator LpoA protein